MIPNFGTFSILLNIISVIIVFCLAVSIWNKRPAPGTEPFTLFLLVVLIWIFVRSIMAAADDIQTKTSLSILLYCLTAAISITWLCFTLDYSGSRWWRRPRNIILLVLVPLITVVLMSIDFQGFSERLRLSADIEASRSIVVWERGVFTWLQTAYFGILLAAGSLVLCRFVYINRSGQRWKTIVLLVGTLIPIVVHAVSTIGYYPLKGLDLTPIALTLAGIVYLTTIFRFHLMDIIPAARDTLVEKIPDGILVLDAEGRVVDLNPAAERLTGINQAAARGKNLAIICPWLEKVISCIGSGRRIELVPTITGSRLFLEASVTPLTDPQSVVTGWLIIIEDISHRKKADEALKDSEEKYRSLVNNIKLGVFRVTHQGTYLEVNTAMENITGYSREELLHMYAGDLYLYPADRQAVLDQSTLTPERATSEVWNRKKDGSRIMVALTLTPVKAPDGNLLYYDGILEDITERNKLVEQIRELYEKEKVQRQELEAEAQARGNFINTLGHELRTPLTPIFVSAESLKEFFNRNPDNIESKLINNVYNGSRALLQRLNELLELGRFSREAVTLRLEPIELKAVVEKAVERSQLEISARNQQLLLDLAGDLPAFEADTVLLEQVLFNLLSNASKLSPEGGKVVLRSRAAEGGVLVEIQDEGKGISAEEEKRLFQPYHRVEQDRARFQGLGLGLAISRQIIDAHHGRIWLNTLPGKGSIFSFFLPAKPE